MKGVKREKEKKEGVIIKSRILKGLDDIRG